MNGICATIECGDCIEKMQDQPTGQYSLVFSDPPFNINYQYDIYQDTKSVDEYLGWCRRWGSEVVRLLKPNGTFWLAIGDEFAAELKVLFHRELGLHLRSWVVWHYTFGVSCSKKLARSHTHLLYFTKSPTDFYFNEEAVRIPSARQSVYKDKRANSKGKLPDDTWIYRPQEAPGAFGPDTDTWLASRVCGTFKERVGWHPCQMPELVLERILLLCSKPGDWVLDPFAGSATTLVAAKRLGRNTLGFELSPDYAMRGQARVDSIEVEQVA